REPAVEFCGASVLTDEAKWTSDEHRRLRTGRAQTVERSRAAGVGNGDGDGARTKQSNEWLTGSSRSETTDRTDAPLGLVGGATLDWIVPNGPLEMSFTGLAKFG